MDKGPANRRTRRLLAALMVGVAAVAAAGCGLPGTGAQAHTATTANGGSPTASANNAMLAFAQCVRQHGVPKFPDPSGGVMRLQEQNGKTTVNGVPMNVSSATFRAAQQACRSLLPAATGTAAPNPQLKQKAMAFAKCMRSHGVANFPDPDVTSNSIGMHFKGNMNSPTFQAAQKACQSILAAAPGKGG